MLEFVGCKISEGKDKPARADVEVPADSGLEEIGCGRRGNAGVIVGENIIGVEREFIARSLTNRFSGQREAGGLRIAACQRQARVKQAAPEIIDFWMGHF